MENKTTFLRFAAISVIFTILAIFFCDRPLAEFIRSSGYEDAWLFSNGTTFLDTIVGKDISKFLLGFLLLGIGGVVLFVPPTRSYGYSLLFVGIVQFLSTLITGVSKNLFGRLRPYELLANNQQDHAWFVEGSAFPSGHTGFYFGFFLPLAYLYPSWRWPLMIVPFFIAIARINANDHFLGDVTASMALAALITVGVAALMKRQLDRRN